MTKRSRLVRGLFCPAFKWSRNQMVGTGIKSNLKAGHGPAFRWVLYSDSYSTCTYYDKRAT